MLKGLIVAIQLARATSSFVQVTMAMENGTNLIEAYARFRRFNFPLPFPFKEVDILEEYLLYLEGSLPSLHHVTLTEAERSILDAWEEVVKISQKMK